MDNMYANRSVELAGLYDRMWIGRCNTELKASLDVSVLINMGVSGVLRRQRGLGG